MSWFSRPHLSERLARNIAADPGDGPDWVIGLQVACGTQDMEYALDAVARQADPPRVIASIELDLWR